VTQARQRVKPVRTIRMPLPLGPEPHQWGVVEVTVNSTTTAFFLQRISSDWGTGLKLLKKDFADAYHVNLDAEHGHTCECKGFQRWHHYKHVDGLLALRQAGKL
jgi:hypothetical protein